MKVKFDEYEANQLATGDITIYKNSEFYAHITQSKIYVDEQVFIDECKQFIYEEVPRLMNNKKEKMESSRFPNDKEDEYSVIRFLLKQSLLNSPEQDKEKIFGSMEMYYKEYLNDEMDKKHESFEAFCEHIEKLRQVDWLYGDKPVGKA